MKSSEMQGCNRTFGRLVIATLLLAAAVVSHGAERWSELADSVFQHLARDNELPNGAIPTSIAQDGDGFLWIGSQNGLARWDGYHFRLYRADPGKPGALPDNFIQALLTDAHGTLWVGTTSGGLARYDREHDRFIAYPAGPEGLSHVSVRTIADDGEGGVWVATEGGLDHVVAGSVKVRHLRHFEGDSTSLPDNRIRGLLRDRHGTLWVGTATGLLRLEKGSSRFVPVPLPAPEGRVPAPWSFLEDGAGRIWVGTFRQGAYVIDPHTNIAQAVQESAPDRSTLHNEGVSAIVEVVPGQVWLATLGQGIVTVDAATSETRRIRHDPTQPASLPDDSIQALFKDRSGLIWICSNRSISRYEAAQSAMITVFGASGRPDTVSDSNVDAILPMPDGRIWLGLESKGIDVIDPAGLRVAALRPDPQQPEKALPKDYINTFAVSPASDVFVGTEQGLYRVDRTLRRTSRVNIPQRDSTAPVWALLLDDDVLWVGGFDGIWTLDVGSRRTPLPTHADVSSGLSDQRITVIERGEGGALWIGTKNGLNRLDPATHTVERILPDPNNPQSLAAGYITSVLTDSRGRLWVATFGGGINVLESRDASGRPRFRRMGVAQGLNNENTDKLLEDSRRTVWASTDSGLAMIDESTFAIRTFRGAEGLPISSYWVGSGAQTPQGEMLFGGVGGLSVVLPERLSQWTYRPPIAITDVRIGGKQIPAGTINHGETAPLTIAPTSNSLAVEFSALDFSAPERNRYAYRLAGYDSGWVDTEAVHRVAAYTNLPPGNYTLQLRGSNRDGAWTQSTLSVPIRVLPAWYQTIAFRIAVALAAIAIVAAVVQGRTMYLRRKQRDLERQVIERTAELRESQRQLEQIAYYDTLTALPNRRMFTEEFRELIMLARLQSERFALLLIDLDRFKQINDSLGHDAGDSLLIEAAIRLQAAVRKSDCVARLGGDEFGVLVAQNPAATDIENICRRIVESFIMPVSAGGANVKSSASIGVAVFGDHGSTLDSLYKSADVALYEAKRAGGNLWRWHRRHSSGSESDHPAFLG